jgi:drug/metabolite transporter (DMT)-like permease
LKDLLRRHWVPLLALSVTVIFWGFNFAMIKMAIDGLNEAVPGHGGEPVVAALVRWVLMMPLLYGVCRLMKLDMSLNREEWLPLLIAGFVASGAYMVLFVIGMQTAPASSGAVALATAPIFMAIFSILTKHDRFRWSLLIGSVVAFAGVAWVITGRTIGQADGDAKGTLIVLASAIVWAYSVILMKPILARHHPLKVMTLSLPGAGLALIPFGLMPTLQTDWAAVTPQGWIGLTYLIIFAGAIAFTCYYIGLSHLGPARTGMIQYLIPPTAYVGAWLIRGEELRLPQIAGLAVVILGVFIGVKRWGPAPLSKSVTE